MASRKPTAPRLMTENNRLGVTTVMIAAITVSRISNASNSFISTSRLSYHPDHDHQAHDKPPQVGGQDAGME